MPVQPHQFGEHLGAWYHGDESLSRSHHFGVIVTHRRRTYDDIGVGYVLAAVAFPDCRADRYEPVSDGRPLHVAPRHAEVVPERQQHFGDAAHAYAADPYKVNMSYASK
jgi:hypothetical protein